MNVPTVLEALKTIPDPRQRQGRQYPLYGLLAVLLLAAMHGEHSLRGMWLWAKRREKEILFTPALGFRAVRRLAGLGTFWYALSKLKGGELGAGIGVGFVTPLTQAWRPGSQARQVHAHIQVVAVAAVSPNRMGVAWGALGDGVYR